MKLFHFLLTFLHQLVSREGIFGTANSLIPYFVMNKLESTNALKTANISKNFFFVFEMTHNCARAISKYKQRM